MGGAVRGAEIQGTLKTEEQVFFYVLKCAP